MDETQANFQELNAQMTQISQTFARIGDHLQVPGLSSSPWGCMYLY